MNSWFWFIQDVHGCASHDACGFGAQAVGAEREGQKAGLQGSFHFFVCKIAFGSNEDENVISRSIVADKGRINVFAAPCDEFLGPVELGGDELAKQ